MHACSQTGSDAAARAPAQTTAVAAAHVQQVSDTAHWQALKLQEPPAKSSDAAAQAPARAAAVPATRVQQVSETAQSQALESHELPANRFRCCSAGTCEGSEQCQQHMSSRSVTRHSGTHANHMNCQRTGSAAAAQAPVRTEAVPATRVQRGKETAH
jgi:hypothetical protein